MSSETLNVSLNVEGRGRSTKRNSSRRQSKLERSKSNIRREKKKARWCAKIMERKKPFKKNYKALKRSYGGGENMNQFANVSIEEAQGDYFILLWITLSRG